MANDLEEKLSSILSNPEMMGKIQAMAQSLGQSEGHQETASTPSIDPAMIQKLSGFAGQSGIDRNQQALLSALSPYLSRDRVGKLENAMRAAKLAKLASGFLGSGGLNALMGR